MWQRTFHFKDIQPRITHFAYAGVHKHLGHAWVYISTWGMVETAAHALVERLYELCAFRQRYGSLDRALCAAETERAQEIIAKCDWAVTR